MHATGSIEIIRSAHIITRHVAILDAATVREIEQAALRTTEIEFGGTGADEVVADVLAREDFFVRAGPDVFIDHLASRLI